MRTAKPHVFHGYICIFCGRTYTSVAASSDEFNCKGMMGTWNYPKNLPPGTSTTTGTSATAPSGSQKDMKTASPSGAPTTSQKTTPDQQQSDGGFNKEAYEAYKRLL